MLSKVEIDEAMGDKDSGFIFNFNFYKGYDKSIESYSSKQLEQLKIEELESIKILDREMQGTYWSVVAYWQGIVNAIRDIMNNDWSNSTADTTNSRR